MGDDLCMDSEEKISFEMYINRFCKTYNCTKEEALHMAVVKKNKRDVRGESIK